MFYKLLSGSRLQAQVRDAYQALCNRVWETKALSKGEILQGTLVIAYFLFWCEEQGMEMEVMETLMCPLVPCNAENLANIGTQQILGVQLTC